jgi:uncharacterized RDD family membrane protein YckC
MLDLAAGEAEPDPIPAAAQRRAHSDSRPDAVGTAVAGLFSRLVAAAIDVMILAGIDALIVYFTMQICGLSMADIGVLPKAPLAFFLLIQNAAYLVAFTAGGQTLGKMALGIKVVAADDLQPPDVARALRRSVWWLLLAVPAGLGFVSALLTPDRRGLHDRLAGTRVVRATLG